MDTIGAFMFPGQWAGSFEPTAHSYVTGSHFYGGYRGGGLRNGWDEGWGGLPRDHQKIWKWVFFCQATQRIGSCLIPEKAEIVQGGRLGWRVVLGLA